MSVPSKSLCCVFYQIEWFTAETEICIVFILCTCRLAKAQPFKTLIFVDSIFVLTIEAYFSEF